MNRLIETNENQWESMKWIYPMNPLIRNIRKSMRIHELNQFDDCINTNQRKSMKIHEINQFDESIDKNEWKPMRILEMNQFNESSHRKILKKQWEST